MANNTTTIGLNSFVLRQTARSKYSHFAGTDEELSALVAKHFHKARDGYRDGVVLVSLPPEGFFSGVVEVTSETKLHAVFAARNSKEAPYVQVVALGAQKLQAAFVEAVLYRRDVLLEEGPDAVSTECEWEIVSLNARPTAETEPLTPMAMARNLLGLPGGTKATYTADEFARAIMYWSNRVMSGDDPMAEAMIQQEAEEKKNLEELKNLQRQMRALIQRMGGSPW